MVDASKKKIRLGWQDDGLEFLDHRPRSTCGHPPWTLRAIAGGPSGFANSDNLGTREADAISTTTSSGTTVAYPIYDAQGEDRGRRHEVARYCDRRLVGGYGVC